MHGGNPEQQKLMSRILDLAPSVSRIRDLASGVSRTRDLASGVSRIRVKSA